MKEGTIINQYKIISAIGKGGMGEVFLAEDTKLKRQVALKILPPEFAEDKDRMSRFIREAQSASALNHPNIITIYEIGESDGTHFIATEFIDGKTLNEYKKANPLNYKSALEIAIQVASALDEAHSAGIVHRDIKPDNVMIRSNGLAKILDFGIAKLSTPKTINEEDATAIKGGTSPGMIIGTANYMSPEQAEGKEVDARTDIFSFGVLFYEMIEGQLPFEGDSPMKMIGAILKDAPKPLKSEVPTEIVKIINKCLRKNRDERYQTIKDVGNDLKDVKQDLEFQDKLERSIVPNQDENKTQIIQPATGGETKIQTASSAEYLISQAKGRKKAIVIGLGVLTLVIAGVAFGIYKFAFSKQSASTASFESMKITKLTDTGKAGSAAISPDGKYVVHVKQDAGQQSLWVRHIATGSNVQIIPPADVLYGRMTFTPDGGYIYFMKQEKGEPNFSLHQVPVLGGESKKLNPHANSPVTFSPDGKRIAFVRNTPGESAMILANADGTGEQSLAILKSPESFKPSGPAWSPDGKVIASGGIAVDENGNYQRILEIQVADGTIKPMASKWLDVGQIAWLADGSGLIMNNYTQGSNAAQIYQISYPQGEARKVTNDLLSYHGVSMTADSDSIVVIQEDRVYNVWSAPDGDTSRPKQLTRGSGKFEGINGIEWTPDGNIVFSSLLALAEDISIMNGDGSNPRRLTETRGTQPSISPDGRYVVFVVQVGGKSSIRRMDIDGGNAKQLTNEGELPNVSPDGRWVIYTAGESGQTRLWKVSIDGGEPIKLTDYESNRASVSVDGKSIACFYREQNNSPMKIAIIPFEGGKPTKLLSLPANFDLPRNRRIHWLPDGRSLAYVATKDGVSNVWSLPIDGGSPKQLTNFTTDQILWFDLSRDGKPTLFSRGTTTKDVVLISGLKK